MTAQCKLPSFKQYLLEDEGEDIVSGLRKLVSDIRSNWRTPYSAVRKEQERAWKKLTPAQQQALKALLRRSTLSMMSHIATPIDTAPYKPTTKPEAIAMTLSFLRMSKDMQVIGESFLQEISTGPTPILTVEEARLHEDQINMNGKPQDRQLGTTTLKFVNDHQQLLSRIVVKEDEGAFGFDVYTVPAQLAQALSKTPDDKRKDAAIGVHYLLLRMAFYFAQASEELRARFAGNKLPDEAPDAAKKPATVPPGGTPAPVTTP